MSADLRLRDVDVSLGGVRILDGVSLDVHAGETFGIIGPNGAGKTTVLNAISGVVPLVCGSVELDGVSLAGTRPHRLRELGMGRSLQTTQFFRDLTALELVALSAAPNTLFSALRLRAHRDKGGEAGEGGERSAAMDALERLALADVAHTRVGELPSGVQKLVDLARAILAGRSVLLLDEPTSGVGSHERRLVRSVLDELGAEGRTIVVVDHDPGFVASCCERVVCMNFGAVLVTGPPDEVLGSDEVRRSYLGDVA
jgi:branched-chain amino acid transport system ATP-binding protein